MPLLEGRSPLQVSRPLTYQGNGKSAVTAKAGQSSKNRSIRESGWSDLLFRCHALFYALCHLSLVLRLCPIPPLAKITMPCFSFRMNRLLLLLATLLLPALAARAEEWMSAQFRCALNLPPEESWQRGNATPLKNVPGDLIFWAVHPESKQRMAVTVTTNVPSNNINSTAMIHRVMECMLKEFGLSIGARSTVEVYGQSFLQLVGTRNEGTGGTTFALARAALRDNILYIAVAMAPSEEDLSADKISRACWTRFASSRLRRRSPRKRSRIITGTIAACRRVSQPQAAFCWRWEW
jgi:hypothetical protein